MRRTLTFALLAVILVPGSAGSARARTAAIFMPAAGHRLAGFALDREWLALAEDPIRPGGCPEVQLVDATGGAPRTLTSADGPTCKVGGRFWVRPDGRAIGVAIVRALWVVRHGITAVAVKASPHEPEVVLSEVSGIDAVSGPFLGPVVATNWLRLFGRYARGAQGTYRGAVISGNRRTLWTATGPVPPLGLDDQEHVVSVGAKGAIAMWQAHGARYGRVAGARARAAAVDDGMVTTLRSDRPRLDVRTLSGRLVASWPVILGAASLLDESSGVAAYMAGGAVHELNLRTGSDEVIARAPPGATLIDAQIEPRLVAYAYRGGPAGAGRVVVLGR